MQAPATVPGMDEGEGAPSRRDHPFLQISLTKLRNNAHAIAELCHSHGIRVAGVTKVFCGHRAGATAMVEGGVDLIADSRVSNLKRLQDLALPKLLLRLPMLSETEDVVRYADISLNSEPETIQALASAAQRQHKVHGIVLMVELGDLREGIVDEKTLLETLATASTLEGIRVLGLGTNFTCYGGVIPTEQKLAGLVALRDRIKARSDCSLEVISGGNSSTLHLLDEGKVPSEVNELRLGEAIVLGRETAYGQSIRGTFDDCFRLWAEIIEVKAKRSIPVGRRGLNASGHLTRFVDRGVRSRAICALGTQDVLPEQLIPEDENVMVLGASSDHLILDVSDCYHVYRVGELISFKLTYAGVLSTMSSGDVTKEFRQ